MQRVSRPRRTLIVAVGALALAVLAPVAADAAVPLAPPLSVDSTVDRSFDEPSATALAVGASDDGDVLAAWRGSGSSTGAVKLALWPAGASAPAIVDGGLGSDPDAAMAPDGHALAAWTGSDGRLRISSRQPGGAFPQQPTTIDARPPPFAGADPSRWGAPAVALRPDGSGLVAVPTCLSFGGNSDLVLRVFDVAADGSVVVDDARQPQSDWSSVGCAGPIGVTRAAVGAGGRAAATFCITAASVCLLATRADATAQWTVMGVDGTSYGLRTTAAVPLITPSGRTIVVWRSTASRFPTIYTANGTGADAMSLPQMVSDGSISSAAPELTVLGGDALALFQTSVGDGSFEPLARPLFSAGTLGDRASVAPASFQASAPYADPHAATWPDGSGLIALAGQASARATPLLTLLERSLGGTLTPVQLGARTSAVTLPRVAVAGTPAQPLGLVATREAPAGGGTATIVLRRIDGAPPRIALRVPSSVVAGTPVRLAADVSDASGPVAIAWSLGDGATAQGAEVDHVFAEPGTRTLVVTATDALGNVASASATLVVGPRVPGGGGGGGGGVADRVKPALSKVRLSATRFRAGRASTALAARASRGRRRAAVPSGTTLRFTLSEAATVRVAVVRLRSGRTQRGKCRAGARRGRRCTLRATVKSFTRRRPAGAGSIAFSARFGRRALPAGGYELRLVPTDAAGNRGATRTVRFTLVR